jgi:MHS family citrate/tricarballylate:H+ symporter-like MFS transporter
MATMSTDAPALGRQNGAGLIPFRQVAAVVVGNGLEFYDFLTYGYFAIYIGRTFFPTQSASSSLLLSLATFGAGFLTRPIGAMVIGPMGDRIGRKPAMMMSFGLMGIAIVGLALTPSYARIGIAAPILVLLFRLVQGFALGGEVGPTTAYLVEAAPSNRRGFYASMQYATQDSAVLAAGLIGTLLAYLLDAQQLQDWGWRIAMLIGAAIVPFGLIVRSRLPETLHAADDAALAPDATTGTLASKPGVRPYFALILFGLMMLTAGTIGSYSVSYMTTYALTILHMPAVVAFGVIIVGSVVSVPFELLSGWLSDRFGRKPVMLIPGFLLLASILPAFWVISHFRTMATFYGAVAWLNLLASLSSTPVICTLTESLPKRIRSGAVATIYAFAISIFGGSTQFTLTWLLGMTGNPLAPAIYWTCASVVGLTAMVLVKESAPVRVRRQSLDREAL